MPDKFKYYYLDEDQEIICVSTQADLTEVLSLGTMSIVKLIVAENQTQARALLLEELQEPSSARLRSELSGIHLVDEPDFRPSATVRFDKLNLEAIEQQPIAIERSKTASLLEDVPMAAAA